MEQIKMVDLHGQYLRIKPEIDGAIQEVLTSTAFIQGPQVKVFAKALADYVNSPFVVTCGNGTDALQIAMMALDLKPGDEIILPVHTYVATAEVIGLLGLVPVFVDVHQDSFNINPGLIEEKITQRTRAIVPVHLYGQCADMHPLQEIAKRHNLFIIEDAAQALGAVYTFPDGTKRHAGTIGTIGTTSFFPSKNLGCFGDGGAIFTSDPALAEKMQMIANHGQRKKYHHEVIGVNSRLDTLQAAILNVKIRYLDEYTLKRREVASRYDELLQGCENVTTPVRSSFSTHVFHQYTLQVEQRDELKNFLESKGIPTMIYYPLPLNEQKAYQTYNVEGVSFPVTEALSRTVLSLPLHTELNEREIRLITDSIRNFF
jgi:UDP-2-acetamido-2-deoxy-ribo-hexuluronate aminotransferase